jgi:hypothetical protein
MVKTDSTAQLDVRLKLVADGDETYTEVYH